MFARQLERLSALWSRQKLDAWDASGIQDGWFDAHFHHAANVVAEWVGVERLKAGRLLDFGCGDGITMLALMLRHGVRQAHGVDVSRTHLNLGKLALREIGLRQLPAGLSFTRIDPGQPVVAQQRFDIIMSWSTFEHVRTDYLEGIFSNLHDVLAPDGVFFLQISPLFYSPFGSHLGRFNLPPWAHLLWTDDALRRAVFDFAGELPTDEIEENFHTRGLDGYKHFVLKEYDELNRLTGSNLIARVQACGFDLVREGYGPTSIQPPEQLLQRYSRRDLIDEEIVLLFKRRA
jgi:cyclopropane fatty-acyl-phospholipid synthase-like methyltransferase